MYVTDYFANLNKLPLEAKILGHFWHVSSGYANICSFALGKAWLGKVNWTKEWGQDLVGATATKSPSFLSLTCLHPILCPLPSQPLCSLSWGNQCVCCCADSATTGSNQVVHVLNSRKAFHAGETHLLLVSPKEWVLLPKSLETTELVATSLNKSAD